MSYEAVGLREKDFKVMMRDIMAPIYVAQKSRSSDVEVLVNIKKTSGATESTSGSNRKKLNSAPDRSGSEFSLPQRRHIYL